MRKIKYNLFLSMLVLVTAGLVITSCKKDDDNPPVLEAEITSFAISDAGVAGDVEVAGVIDGLAIAVAVPFETDLTALTAVVEATENATVVPASGTTLDFTEPRNFVVTNGDVQSTYVVTVTKEDPTAAVLISMDVKSAGLEEAYDVEIDPAANEVTVTYNNLQTDIAVISNVVAGPAGATYTTSSGTDTLDLSADNNTITISYAGEDRAYSVVANVTEAGLNPESATLVIDKSAASGLVPTEIADNNSRGAAFNGRYVIVPDHGAKKIFFWDLEASVIEADTLAMAGISGGSWLVSDVQVQGDAIYVSNMVMAAADAVFKVYKWDNVDDETPEVVLSYTTTAADQRLGDAISVIGDPSTDGYIVASNFPGYGGKVASEIFVFKATSGVFGDPSIYDLAITEGAKLGQYGRFHEVPGMPEYFVGSGAEAGITIIDPANGSVVYEVPASLIQGRAHDPHIFEYNGGRYLTYTVNREWEANGAFYEIVNISGGENALEGLQLLSDANITERIVYSKNFSAAADPWVAASNGVAFDSNNDPMIFGFTVLNGFIVESFTK